MRANERDEIIIRMDERIKTVFNQMEAFDKLFTNHLHHHEMWENDMKVQFRWAIGIMSTLIGGMIAALRYI